MGAGTGGPRGIRKNPVGLSGKNIAVQPDLASYERPVRTWKSANDLIA